MDGRCDGTEDDDVQSGLVLCGTAGRVTDLEDLGRRDTSGYGRSDPVTSALRNGMEYMTPRMPPIAQTATVVQYGNPDHQPIITRPGITKMIADNVPAADAIVCTMLFSTTEWSAKYRRIAIDTTAAGMAVAKVSPTQAEIDVGRGEHQRDDAEDDSRSVISLPRSLPWLRFQAFR